MSTWHDKTVKDFVERIDHWLADIELACRGDYGPTPKGEPIDFWRGKREALAEIKCFVPEHLDKMREHLEKRLEVDQKCAAAWCQAGNTELATYYEGAVSEIKILLND